MRRSLISAALVVAVLTSAVSAHTFGWVPGYDFQGWHGHHRWWKHHDWRENRHWYYHGNGHDPDRHWEHHGHDDRER